MTKRTDNTTFDKVQNKLDFERAVSQLYASRHFTTEHVAKTYGITPRSVQRIAKKWGVIRTRAESNKLVAPLKHYHRVPKELRVKRKHLLKRVRFQLIQEHPYCSLCGGRPRDGYRLEIDHIDDDATNNELSNLQVLCSACNIGKSGARRWGIT